MYGEGAEEARIGDYPAIEDEDLTKMYSFFSSNQEDAQLLQHKVFVDIIIHFGRRGRENLSNLKRGDLAVRHDSEGKLQVYKTDC